MLKPEDKQLLLDVYRAEYLRTDQLAEIRCPNVAKPPTRLKAGRRCATRLVEHRYLRRIKQPRHPDDTSGSKPHIFTLDINGAHVVADMLGVDPRSITWNVRASRERNMTHMQHTLELADFWLSLRHSCQELNTTLVEWQSETALKQEPMRIADPHDKTGKRQVSVLPDAFYTLKSPGGLLAYCCHEHDRGTEPITSKKQRAFWEQKFAHYQALFEASVLQKRFEFDGPVRITVTTTTKQRLQNIKEIGEKVLGPDNHSVWLTTFANMQPIQPAPTDPPPINILSESIWSVSGFDTLHCLLLEREVSGITQ